MKKGLGPVLLLGSLLLVPVAFAADTVVATPKTLDGTVTLHTDSVGIVGGGGNELTNEHGVVLHLSRTTKGLKIKVGVDGVKMTLKDTK